ncbi:MAG: hypothetical protein Q8M07_20870 [Prosthecobacter sp.]|nr:hypothetical protein [Prosthecobacter sp.]
MSALERQELIANMKPSMPGSLMIQAAILRGMPLPPGWPHKRPPPGTLASAKQWMKEWRQKHPPFWPEGM